MEVRCSELTAATTEIAITDLRMSDTYHYVFLGVSSKCGTWKDNNQKPTFDLGLRLEHIFVFYVWALSM